VQHAVPDGQSFWRFMDEWSAPALGQPSAPAPVFDRSAIVHPMAAVMAQRILRKVTPELPLVISFLYVRMCIFDENSLSHLIFSVFYKFSSKFVAPHREFVEANMATPRHDHARARAPPHRRYQEPHRGARRGHHIPRAGAASGGGGRSNRSAASPRFPLPSAPIVGQSHQAVPAVARPVTPNTNVREGTENKGLI
jgi:hypothetical protein